MTTSVIRERIIEAIAKYSDREGFSECTGQEIMFETGLTKEQAGGHINAMKNDNLIEIEDWDNGDCKQRFLHLTDEGWLLAG